MKILSARYQKGFTLVELVIVIALLAALALGVLAALDPLEQLRKGNDTTKRDIATQFYTASVRYYAIEERMPWCDAAGTCTLDSPTALADADTVIDELIEFGELKETFPEVYETQNQEVYASGDDTSVNVCFAPQSKAFKADANSRYTDNSGLDSSCTPDPSGDCFWCAK